MVPRTLTLIILATLITLGSPVSAKEKKKPAKQTATTPKKLEKITFRQIADYVLKNGDDQTIDAPISRNLGFTSDEITTKALRHKSKVSPDKKSHGFYVIFSKDADEHLIPMEIVLSNTRITVGSDGAKYVEGFNAKLDLNGHLLAAVNSKGPSNNVIQYPITPDSPEAIALYKDEASIHLEKMEMTTLTK